MLARQGKRSPSRASRRQATTSAEAPLRSRTRPRESSTISTETPKLETSQLFPASAMRHMSERASPSTSWSDPRRLTQGLVESDIEKC